MKKSLVSRSWVYDFQARYKSEIALRTPRLTEDLTAKVTAAQISEWFDTYEGLRNSGLYDPRLIANTDETMLQAYQKVRRVFVPYDCPNPQLLGDERVMHITIVPTVFANGDHHEKPLVNLPQITLPTDLYDDLVACFHWAGQPSGWMDTAIFDS